MLGLFLNLLNNYVPGTHCSDDELLSLSEVVLTHWREPRWNTRCYVVQAILWKLENLPLLSLREWAVCYCSSKLYRQKHKMFLFTVCLFFLCVRLPAGRVLPGIVNSSYKMFKRGQMFPGVCLQHLNYTLSLAYPWHWKKRTKES